MLLILQGDPMPPYLCNEFNVVKVNRLDGLVDHLLLIQSGHKGKAVQVMMMMTEIQECH